MKKITYKGQFGNVVQDVEYNDVNLPNLMTTEIYTGDHIPKVDEVVYLSTCDIPYHNNWDDCWTSRPNDDEYFSQVTLELIGYDDSNYDPRKCHNGGKYLESEWLIREVKSVSTFGEKY